ncbi:hypothetical protein QBC34DRAFT_493465 [Podospora aff. communis PSN243]|uniref:NACHT domain-containing protein n=1 Tax=Podospora aff. communis PSN243 TaxID=3040156 RepID=A0AAV9GQ47_9PEZI|nr:hypothetical protein QBC34DRAFT_493465 [Podospora aff. communis PSN243]
MSRVARSRDRDPPYWSTPCPGSSGPESGTNRTGTILIGRAGTPYTWFVLLGGHDQDRDISLQKVVYRGYGMVSYCLRRAPRDMIGRSKPLEMLVDRCLSHKPQSPAEGSFCGQLNLEPQPKIHHQSFNSIKPRDLFDFLRTHRPPLCTTSFPVPIYSRREGMDPLSLIAGAAGILSLGIQVTQSLIAFYQGAKCDAARTLEKLGRLLAILKLTHNHLEKRRFRDDECSLAKQIEVLVQACGASIRELQSQSERVKRQSTGVRGVASSVSRKLAFHLRQSTLQRVERDVDQVVLHMGLAMQLLQQKAVDRVEDDIGSLLDSLSVRKASALSDEEPQWLTVPDMSPHYNEAAKRRHPGTGLWFVESATFGDWLAKPNSLLWLNGFAGCGKSVLCSTAIEHVLRYRQANSHAKIGVAMFFFAFSDDSRQDASAMLRSLISQLSSQLGKEHRLVARLCKGYRSTTPPDHLLVELLRQLVQAFTGGVFFVLDALDESPRGKQRREVLQIITDARKWSEAGLHLLVSSRDEVDIHEELEAIPAGYMSTVSMKNEFVDQDIAVFIASHIRTNRQLQKWEAHYEEIEKALIKGAEGVFRWAECQLLSLESCPGSKRHLDSLLASLPRSLDKTYERMLESIAEESIEEGRRILTLLCCAKRPLTIPELIDCVAVELGESPGFNPDARLLDENEIRRICPGFIEVDEHLADGPPTVRIAHYSIQEYLESRRICEQQRVARFSVKRPDANALAASICLTYLLEPAVVAMSSKPEGEEAMNKEYPLASYAAQSWYAHYRDGDSGSHGVRQQILRLFHNDNGAFDNWVLTWNVDKYDGRKPEGKTQSPVYYAALLGLDFVIGSLFDDGQARTTSARPGASTRAIESINGEGGTCGSALQAASCAGREDVVRILLSHGAEVNAESGYFGSPLQAAAAAGHKGVVELLLASGANVHQLGGWHGGALHAASARGHDAIVELLLANSADVNAQFGWYGNPLQAASARGHERVVRRLLDAGAKTDAAGGKYGNALKAASRGGFDEVVRILVEKGAKKTWDEKLVQRITQGGGDCMCGFYMQYLQSLCRRRGWHDPMYECYRDSQGYRCLVLVNGREYETDLAYESGSTAQENAAMRAFMSGRKTEKLGAGFFRFPCGVFLYDVNPMQPVIMGWTKDQMIEEMEEEREELEQALDDIEAYGERFEWCVFASSSLSDY